MVVHKSIEIAAPPEKIWPFLVEPEKVLKWCITFKKFEYTTEKRSGIDASFYVEEKASGQLMKLNFVVTDWVDNKKIAFRMVSGTGVKGYEQRWILEPTVSGTKFTFIEQVDLPFGFIGKFIGLFAKRGSETTVLKMLTKLKNMAEI